MYLKTDCQICFRTSTVEQTVEEEIELIEDKDVTVTNDNQIKLFSCALCSISFGKFQAYRDHFASTEHRYKRRDEKKRLGVW